MSVDQWDQMTDKVCRMPATGSKRKSGWTANSAAKKSKTTKPKYGGGDKKYKDKYSAKGIDWDTVTKLADAAVQKNIGRSIETQKSEGLIKLNYRTVASQNNFTGFDLVALNQNWTSATDSTGKAIYNPVAVYNQMLVFNLSALSQVKGTQGGSISGWRQGNKINAMNLTLSLKGGVHDISADCEYHILLARRKDGAHAGDYQQPTIVTSDQMNLFKPLADGPFATTNYGYSSAVPNVQYLSMLSRNTDVWSFTEKGHVSKKILAAPQGGTITTNSAVDLTLFHSFSSSTGLWDFTTNTATNPVLKGGDYYAFVWREGAVDTQMEQFLSLYFKLSYKDG